MNKQYDNVLHFENLGMCYYELDGIRQPKAKEYYLSGAYVIAYKAYADLKSYYQVVRPTHKALPVQGYVRGAAVIQCNE